MHMASPCTVCWETVETSLLGCSHGHGLCQSCSSAFITCSLRDG